MPAHTPGNPQYQTRVLIVGNAENIGVHLAKKLISQQLEVSLLTEEEFPRNDPLTEIGQSPLFSTQKDISFTDQYRYIFCVTDLFNLSRVQLSQVIDLARAQQARLCVVISKHQKLSRIQKRNLQKIQTVLVKELGSGKIDVRLACLNNIFGKYIFKRKHSIMGGFFHDLNENKLRIVGDDQQALFPLPIQDAVEGVVRSVFLSNSSAKIFELGGELISLLNLSYKIRTLSRTQDLEISVVNTLKFTHEIDAEQILATWNELRWQPHSNLDQELVETLAWVETTKPFVRKNNNKIPTPLPDPIAQTERPTPPLLPQPDEKPLHHTTIVSSATPNSPPSQKLAPLPSSEPIVDTPQIQTSVAHDSLTKTFSLDKNKSFLGFSFPTSSKNSAKPLSQEKAAVKEKKRSSYKKGLFILLITVMIVLSPILLTGFEMFRLYRNLLSVNRAVAVGDYQRIFELSDQTKQRVTSVENKLAVGKPVIEAIMGDSSTRHMFLLLELSRETSDALHTASKALEQASELTGLISQQEKGNIPLVLDQTRVEVLDTYHRLSTIQSLLHKNPSLKDIKLAGIGLKIQQFEEDLEIYQDYVNQSYQLLDKSPELLGFYQKKTYLVLLQNDAELRPTGGFIGSYALLTFQQGKLINLEVEDVYTADGQLRGYVEPPEPIRQYLGEASWFLRDVNWDPHFPTTAAQAAWFLEKQMNQKVDGVVGINMRVIQGLLEATGPITVIDYDIEVTADNLFEKAEYQTEVNFFPGSTQKKDFLGKLTNGLLDQILEGDSQQWLRVGRNLIDSAQQKQLIVSMFDDKTAQVFSNLEWDGGLVDPECGREVIVKNCLVDYLAIREANLGVNKANYFIQRQIQREVSINESGEVQEVVTLNLLNSSPSDAWPGGTYKNYIRLYTPEGTDYRSVSLNQKILDSELISVGEEHGKQVLGFLVEVAPGEQTNVTVSYTLAQKLGDDQLVAYSSYYQKQPGTGNDPYTVKVNVPDSFSLINASQQVKQTNEQISISETLSSDKQFTVEFTR